MKQLLVSVIEDTAKRAGVFLRTRYGIWSIGLISFIESALPVPLVTDPFLAAYIVANKSRAWFGLVVTTAASVFGGFVAYLTAAGLYTVLTSTILTGDTLVEFEGLRAFVEDSVFWFTLIGAFTPVPYTIVGYAAGFVEAHIGLFLAASVIGRGIRYAIVAYFTYRFGEQALELARRNILIASIVGTILVVCVLYIKFYV